jgi:hypothetical protein
MHNSRTRGTVPTNAAPTRSSSSFGLKLLSTVFEWLDACRLSTRIGVMTYKTYCTGQWASAAGAEREADAIERIAATSTMIQVICWPCLDEFNSTSQHGGDPHYNLAFGNVSIENALAGNLPRCPTCNKSMSPSGVGSSSNIGDRQEQLRRFLADSGQRVRSSLAFRAARAVARLGR